MDGTKFLKLALGIFSRQVVDGAFAFTALVLGWLLAPIGDPTLGQLAMFALYGVIALAILMVRR